MENHQPHAKKHDVSIALTLNKVLTAPSKDPTFTSISMVIELSLAFIITFMIFLFITWK